MSHTNTPEVQLASGERPSVQTGTCFGYGFLSSERLEYLRPGTGSPLVISRQDETAGMHDVRLLQTWERLPGKRREIALYATRAGYLVSIENVDFFHITPDTSTISATSSAPNRVFETLLFATPVAVLVTQRGDLVLHAASVDIDGNGVLVVARTGTGKSSTAAALHLAGHRVLSDDASACSTRRGSTPAILPGPAVIRLRDVPAADLADTYVTHDDGQKTHHAIAHERRGDGRPVHLRAIVFLRTMPTMRVDHIPVSEAIKSLWSTSFYIPTDEGRTTCFRGIVDLATSTPAWTIARPLETTTLDWVVRRIESIARGEQ